MFKTKLFSVCVFLINHNNHKFLIEYTFTIALGKLRSCSDGFWSAKACWASWFCFSPPSSLFMSSLIFDCPWSDWLASRSFLHRNHRLKYTDRNSSSPSNDTVRRLCHHLVTAAEGKKSDEGNLSRCNVRGFVFFAHSTTSYTGLSRVPIFHKRRGKVT